MMIMNDELHMWKKVVTDFEVLFLSLSGDTAETDKNLILTSFQPRFELSYHLNAKPEW
jgi:hypothetical protein